jgi:hypothetical protein
MVRNLLLAVQEYAFLVSRINECCWTIWLCFGYARELKLE